MAARANGEPRPRTDRYLRRRALRILPAYWFALTVLAVFPGIVGVFTGDWWRYYFFLQLYDRDTVVLGIPITWTLCVEVTFYLALPLWAAGVRRLHLGSGPWAWLRAELAALALLAAAGAAVQIAAGREAIDDVFAQSLLGQSHLVRARHGARGRERRRGARHRPLARATARRGRAPRAVLGRRRSRRSSRSSWCATSRTASSASLLALQTVAAVPEAARGPRADRADARPRPRAGGLGRARARCLSGCWRAAPLAWLGLISYGVFLWHLTIAELLILPENAA